MRTWEEFDNLPLEEQQRQAMIRNVEFDARMATNAGRKIITERGIVLSQLENTEIPATVAARGWKRYVRTPKPYHPALVREFYAAMVPAAFNRQNVVIVRGVPVVISVDRINRYLRTVRPQGLELTYGLSPHAAFEDPMREQIASSLRRNGNGLWDKYEAKLKKNELYSDLAFWSLFVRSSLRPSSHHTYINTDVARVLFSIQHGLDMDIGHIIHLEILDAGSNPRTKLPFPCLITYFCRKAGIVAASEAAALIHPQRDLGWSVYNIQELTHETDEERAARRAVAQTQHQPPPPAPQGGHQTSDGMAQMLASIEAIGTRLDHRFTELRDEVRSEISSLRDQVGTSVTTVEGLQTAVINLDNRMADRGFGQGYLTGDARRRARAHRHAD